MTRFSGVTLIWILGLGMIRRRFVVIVALTLLLLPISVSRAVQAQGAFNIHANLGGHDVQIEVTPNLVVTARESEVDTAIFFGPSEQKLTESLRRAAALSDPNGVLHARSFWYERDDRTCGFPSVVSSLCASEGTVYVENLALEAILAGGPEQLPFPAPEVTAETVEGVAVLIDQSIAWHTTGNARDGLVTCGAPPPRVARDCILRIALDSATSLRATFSIPNVPLVPDRAARAEIESGLIDAGKSLLFSKRF